MIRFVILRLVLPLLLFLVLRSILRGVIEAFRSAASTARQVPQVRQPPSVPVGGELRKDPVCGTYVSTTGSISRNVKGQVFYFCSEECRAKHRG